MEARDAVRRCGASPPDRPPRRRAWGGRPPSAPRPQARIGDAPTGPCQAVRPSLFDRARSSPWPPGQEIPFDRQLADLGVELGRLALALLLAISGTVASSRSASTAIFALNAASNFLRDFVIPRSIGCDRAGHFTP